MKTKVCIRCKKEKSLTCFNKYEYERVRNICKKCQRRKMVEWETRNKETFVPEVSAALRKVCSRCKQEKQGTEFYNDRSKKSGLTSTCRLCSVERVSIYYKNNKEKEDNRTYRAYVKRTFGITVEDKNRIFTEQGSKCAVCESKDSGNRYKTWAIDHDHKTGKVRGVLCSKCNVALGLARESVEILGKMITYLLNSRLNSHTGRPAQSAA